MLEVTITSALLLVVVGSILGVFISVQRTAAFTQARVESTDAMRLAMEGLTKELRQASSITGDSDASTLTMATFINGTPTQVTYTVSNGTLYRESGPTFTPVLSSLADNTIFTYTPDAVGAQVVSITLDVHPKQRPDTTLSLTSEVRLRNMGVSS
jgi:hypothetical protein